MTKLLDETPPHNPLTFNLAKVRADFPILNTTVHGKPLVYLDNAATTQKPQSVIDRESHYYQSENSNVHRGVYHLSRLATDAFENARKVMAKFINAPDPAQVIFTRGTTESINLVAYSYARAFLKPGDEIILSHLEHHSNVVPWQLAAQATGAQIRVIPLNENGELRLDEYKKLLSDRTKIVAVNHVSNSLGSINDVRQIIQLAHQHNAVVLIDGAQWVAHAPTDVQALDPDFYAFSGHKLYAPMGIGILYGRKSLLDKMPPFHGGGDMIERVTFEKTTFAPLPNKFEAGTPNVPGAAGLAAAIEYLQSIGFENIHAHEQRLLHHATDKLSKIPGLRIIGAAHNKAAVISFILENPPIAPYDAGSFLDTHGIAVRTGHHCCQPVMDFFKISSTIRASFSFYNTTEEVDALVDALSHLVNKSQNRPAPPAAAPPAELKYPRAVAPSPQAAAGELVETFDFLGDWTERYQQVIDMGSKLPPMPPSYKTPATRVHGCQSIVHLHARPQPSSPDRIEFLADSDADVVKGLIAILQRLYSGQRTAEVLAFDVEAFLKRVGLDQHLTTGRRNGLAAMIERIRKLATEMIANRQ